MTGPGRDVSGDSRDTGGDRDVEIRGRRAVGMDFDTTTTAGTFVAVVVLAAVGMTFTPMTTSTVFMMVVPSVVVFGLLMIALGVKHGEYRASN